MGRAPGTKLYSVPDLKTRGWTEAAIRKFLPTEPDDTHPNPRYANAGAPMKLWLRKRVHRVEKMKQFLAWREGTEERRHAAKQGISTRIDNMVERMHRATITIKRGWSDDQIRQLAERTHGGNYEGDPGPFVWSNKTVKNCIRHCLTNYEELWGLCNRGDTGHEAYTIVRDRVEKLIDDAYPQYHSST